MIKATHITAVCAAAAFWFSFLAWVTAADARNITNELKARAIQDRIVMRQPDQLAQWNTRLGIEIRVSVYCDEELEEHDCAAVLEERISGLLDQGLGPMVE